MLERHRRALDVPAGSTRSPRTSPIRLFRFHCFPKSEISRIFLAAFLVASAFEHFVDVLTAQLAVIGLTTNSVVDRAIQFIRSFSIDQPLDQFNDLRHILGGSGMHCRTSNIESIGRFEERLNVLFCDYFPRSFISIGTINNLVVNVCEVLNLLDLETSKFKIPIKNIEHDAAKRVPQVRVVVDRHPANVHFDFFA